jgi:hypothetical protein
LGTGRVMLARVLSPILLPAIRGRLFACLSAVQYFQEFALTRVCERNCHAVGVAEAFAHRWDNGLCRGLLSILSYNHPSTPSLPELAYHNQRTQAANAQSPKDGGLVTRSPVDVLAGRCPKGDGRHYEVYVCVW